MIKPVRILKSLLLSKNAPHKVRLEDLPEPQAYIVSYPKCGRTWLRTLLGHYICHQHKLDPKLALETLYLTHRAGFLPTHFTHDGTEARRGDWQPLILDKQAYANKRVLLLIRNPRDVMVSCFFQATKRDMAYQGSISDFIRDPVLGAHRYIEFVQSWEENAHIPEALEVMYYKYILADPESHLIRLMSFIGCHQIDRKAVQESVEFASFRNMRELEATNYFSSKRLAPGNVNDPESYKVRRGISGGYRDYLNEEDCRYMDRLIDASPCSLLATYRSDAANPAKTAS